MEITILKDLGLIITSMVLYLKILNIKKNSNTRIIGISIFAIILSLLSHEMHKTSLYISIIVDVILIAIFFKFILRECWELSITTALLSYAMSYVIFVISAFAVTFLMAIFYEPATTKLNVLLPLIVPVQMTLSVLLFRIKRLKSGFPFLRKEGFGYFAVLFSFFILLFMVVSSKKFDLVQLVIVSLVGAIVCAVGMFFWWRASITRAYKDTLKDKEIHDANKQILLIKQELEILKERNQFLASVIHKDNKLIPAMSLAVQRFIELSENQLNDKTKEKVKVIINEMNAQSNERAGILSEYRTEVVRLPKTNIFKLDAVIEYLRIKSLEKGAAFDLMILCDVIFLTKNIIDEAKLVTLLADLIDNAIYAISSRPFKRILTTICIEDGCYEIRVCDSGAYFSPETLHDLGKISVTTHEDDGGSGIGYLTIFKILNEVKASLIIHEYKNKTDTLTKQITVRFDGKCQYYC